MKNKLLFYLSAAVLLGIVILGSYVTFIRDSGPTGSYKIYYFYTEENSRASRPTDLLETYAEQNSGYELIKLEVWSNDKNKQKLKSFADKHEIEEPALPFIVIGETVYQGYLSDLTTGAEIEGALNSCDDMCRLELGDIEEVIFEQEPTTVPIDRVEGDREDIVC